MEKRKTKTKMVLCDQRDIKAIMRSRKFRHYEFVLHKGLKRAKDLFAYHFYYNIEVAELRCLALATLIALAIYCQKRAPQLTMSIEDCEERGLMLLFGIIIAFTVAMPTRFISEE